MANDEPLVSIVCAWFQRREYIKQSIDSLLAQDYANLEVIVVNDGSPDDKVQAILDSYDDFRLKVVYQKNSGFVSALTHGISLTRGKYIAIHGAGDRALPSKISSQVKYIQRKSNVVAVGCSHFLIYSNSNVVDCSYNVIEHLDVKVLQNRVPFTHGTVLYNSESLKEVGGYNKNFKYSQDWDLYSRLIKIGEIHAIPQRLYEKLVFEDGASSSPSKKFIQYEYSKRARNQGDVKEVGLRKFRRLVYVGICFSMAKKMLLAREYLMCRRWIFEMVGVISGVTLSEVDNELFWKSSKGVEL